MIYHNNKEIVARYKGNRKIVLVYRGTKLIWQDVRSCFGAGYWNGDLAWNGDDAWKG